MQCCDCLKGVFYLHYDNDHGSYIKKMHQTLCQLGLGSMTVLQYISCGGRNCALYNAIDTFAMARNAVHYLQLRSMEKFVVK